MNSYSIVTPNRNRLSHLKASLPSWQSLPEVSEIIVVDYGSEKNIKLADFDSAEKVKIIRVNDHGPWSSARAINVGVDFTTNPNICKFDSDIKVTSNDVLHGLDLSNSFYRGHFRSSVSHGQVIFNKSHWESVGGYNEWLSGYGFEDSDFYFRLRSQGYADRLIEKGLSEIQHDDTMRAGRNLVFANDYFRLEFVDPKAKISFENGANTYLAYLKKWSPSCRQKYDFHLLEDSHKQIEVDFPPMPLEYRRMRSFSEFLALTRSHADKQITDILDKMVFDMIQEDGGF